MKMENTVLSITVKAKHNKDQYRTTRQTINHYKIDLEKRVLVLDKLCQIRKLSRQFYLLRQTKRLFHKQILRLKIRLKRF